MMVFIISIGENRSQLTASYLRKSGLSIKLQYHNDHLLHTKLVNNHVLIHLAGTQNG